MKIEVIRLMVMAVGITALSICAGDIPGAQAAEASDASAEPEKVCSEYLAALKTGDFGEIIDFVDPQAMDEFREIILAAEEAQTPEMGKSFLPLFPGTETLEDLRTMSSRELFLTFSRGMSDQSEYVMAILESPDREIVGTYFERDDLAHVLYRVTTTRPLISKKGMEVATLRRENDRWYVVPTGDPWDLVDNLVGSIQANNP